MKNGSVTKINDWHPIDNWHVTLPCFKHSEQNLARFHELNRNDPKVAEVREIFYLNMVLHMTQKLVK